MVCRYLVFQRLITDINSNVGYADMNDGSWAIVVQSPDQGFVVQREFNLTAGGVATTVVVTVRLVFARNKATADL
jgi:hypothetical protein